MASKTPRMAVASPDELDVRSLNAAQDCSTVPRSDGMRLLRAQHGTESHLLEKLAGRLAAIANGPAASTPLGVALDSRLFEAFDGGRATAGEWEHQSDIDPRLVARTVRRILCIGTGDEYGEEVYV